MIFVYGIEQKFWYLLLAWKMRTRVVVFKRPRWFFLFLWGKVWYAFGYLWRKVWYDYFWSLSFWFLTFYSPEFRLKLCWGDQRNLTLWWLLLLQLLLQLSLQLPFFFGFFLGGGGGGCLGARMTAVLSFCYENQMKYNICSTA